MRSPSRPLAPGDTPTHAKRTSAHGAAGSGTRSKSQHHAWSLRGLPVTLASLGLARQEDGRKEESDLKSHSSSLSPSPLRKRRGGRGGRDSRGATSARRNGQRRSPRAPGSQTPGLLIGGPGDTAAAALTGPTARRWRVRGTRR